MKRLPKLFIIPIAAVALYSCDQKEAALPQEQANSATVDQLFTAALTNDDATIIALAQKEIDFTQTDGTGNTALHVAAESGSLDAVKALVQNKALIDAQNDLGQSPLMLATKANKVDTLRYLLRQGAAPDTKDSKGYRAITLAAEAGNDEAVEALALYSRNYLDDALFMASLRGHSTMIDTLTNYGASVYARIEKDGRTPLMMAAERGHLEAVRVLIDNGANRFSTDNEGNTASQLATTAGHLDVAEYLGAKPATQEFTFTAENYNSIEVAAKQVVAIERKKQAVTPSTTGETPLASSQLKVVKLNNRQLSSPADKTIQETLSFKTYREETLPIQVAAVDDVKVSIKYLYGDHKTVDVFPGETIPDTNLKVVSAEKKRDHSKMTANGAPADVSKVMLEDPTTGERREMTTGLNVGRTEPFAVMKEFSGDSLLVARKGDIFTKSDGTEYEVLEVRSTQVVLMNSTTGNVETVQK